MCYPKRFVPIFLGFWGQLISFGYESVISMVLVHIQRSEEYHPRNNDSTFLGLNCSVNVTLDVPVEWTVSTIQYLHCAYYASVVSTNLLGGYLASRFSPKRVYGTGILISSILMLFIPTANKIHFLLVFVIRIFQGFLDGCSFPAIHGVLSAWSPKTARTRMYTIVKSGANLSPAVAFAVSGITACVVTWSTSLYIYGTCGVLWSGIWLTVVCDTPSQHSKLSVKETLLFEREGSMVQPGSGKVAESIPWRQIASSLPVWAIFVGSFGRNWMFSFVTMGVPQYFKIAFTSNIAEIGLQVALPAVCTTIMTITGGVLIDTLIKSHIVSTTVGRKIAQCFGSGVEACCMFSLRFIDRQEIALIVLCIGIAFSGLGVSGYQVNAIDLSPQYASIITGFYRLGTVGGVINTAVSGTLVPKLVPKIPGTRIMYTLGDSNGPPAVTTT